MKWFTKWKLRRNDRRIQREAQEHHRRFEAGYMRAAFHLLKRQPEAAKIISRPCNSPSDGFDCWMDGRRQSEFMGAAQAIKDWDALHIWPGERPPLPPLPFSLDEDLWRGHKADVYAWGQRIQDECLTRIVER